MESLTKRSETSGGVSAAQGVAERILDRLSGALIYAMVVFSPWAFGTTQAWSIWTMNVAGYVLGGLWLGKRITSFYREHLGSTYQNAECGIEKRKTQRGKWISGSLFALTFLILFYCLIAAANARATYFYAQDRFVYRESISWLPPSYDAFRSWDIFGNYLALACSFWAARDWLQNDTEPRSPSESPLFSRRWKRLLWVISINGGALALEGILQRADNTGKLLWLVEPHLNKDAESQFGPYAYRSNGAQLLNLIWPMTVGLWWSLGQSVKRRGQKRTAHHLLLPMAMLMAAAAIISLSRGGVIVAVAGILAALVILVLANRRGTWKIKSAALTLCFGTLGLAAYVNWADLSKRFSTATTDELSGRLRLFELAGKIIRDYPVFGTGPNTFDPVSQLYRESADEYWAVQVHNDWLETLATFGWVGSSFIWLALLLVLMRPVFSFDGIRVRWVLVIFLWIALGGCLFHAGADFPFQIYSILFLFLMLCAVLSLMTARRT